MSGQSLTQVEQTYHVQRQELGSKWAPNIKTFVGGCGENVQMSILDTIGINLYPMKYVSFLSFEREKSATNDKLIVTNYGEVDILGVMTLWLKLDSFYGRPTITSFEVNGAIQTKWHIVNIDCHLTLGRETLRKLNLNLDYPVNFLENAQYVNWTLGKKLNGTWALVGKVTKIGPWYGDDVCNA